MKIIDIDIVVPILVKEIKPNSIIIPAPEILSIGTASIEVSQSFQCDVNYVGGIVCDTDPQATEATFRKNPGTIVQSISGLHNDTDYYIKGAGLPELGHFTYGEGVKVHTLASPIPDEYQLVEYLESTGTQYINTNVLSTHNTGVYLKAMPLAGQQGSFGQFGYGNRMGFSLFYQGRIVLYYNTTYYFTNIPVSVDNIYEYVFNYNNDGHLGLINNYVTQQYADPIPVSLFAFACNTNGGAQELGRQRIYHLIMTENTTEKRNMYPVYRKSDTKPGMYDIVNDIFYTNQGAGEFEVGPDREWEG